MWIRDNKRIVHNLDQSKWFKVDIGRRFGNDTPGVGVELEADQPGHCVMLYDGQHYYDLTPRKILAEARADYDRLCQAIMNHRSFIDLNEPDGDKEPDSDESQVQQA